MSQLRIPAVYMRGGTSKGVFFLARDLPEDKGERERILLRVVGSPDRYGKHIDGMGGATSSTSKVVILDRSSRADCDVDYLFGAVAVDRPVIDWSGNCGNLTAAVGPCAISMGKGSPPFASGRRTSRRRSSRTSR
jgi:2-methylaconitate cis-trans-isomerase PrpF